MIPPEAVEKSSGARACRKCGECCRQKGFVYLKKGEDERIADYLAMTSFDFVNAYCELQDRQKLVLAKKNGEECVFLGPGGCRIHSVKPKQCLDFPLLWKTERSRTYCEGLSRAGDEQSKGLRETKGRPIL
jgi:Fe-S-cluster containining protein